MLGPRFPGRRLLGSRREAKSRARWRIRRKLQFFFPELEAMERRRLFATMVWDISTGGNWNVAGDWVNQANPADHHVPNSSDNAVIDVPGNVTIMYQGSQPTPLTIQNDDTIWVNGSGAGGDAILTASQGITNDGSILLESSNGAYQSNINTGSSTLINLGTIEASLGSGGNRIFSGTLDNQGTVTADSNDYLEITGTYEAQGGTMSGPAELVGCNLIETASPATASTIIIAGTTDTLSSNNLAGYTILVNGNSLFNSNAILNLGGNVSNLGSILLESSNGAYQSNVATGSDTLTNQGTIEASLGSGGNRIFSGTLDNQGTVTADSNDYLEITGTYQAQGGTMSGPAELVGCNLIETASPASASTIIIAGTTDTLSSNNLAGYTILVNGNSLFNSNAILNLGGNVSNLGSILLESSNGAYQSNVATGSDTLTNQGTIEASLGSGGNRIFSGTLDNQGTVTADSNDYLEITGAYQAQGGTMSGPAELVGCNLIETASPASASTIIIAGTTDTLSSNNLAGYTIWVNGNSLFNSDAILQVGANVSNLGTILLQSSNGAYQSNVATGSFTLTNEGTISSGAGSGGNRIFSGTLDNQGTVNATADYVDIEGIYIADGGAITGSGYVVNCTLEETTTPAAASTILISGTTTTLITNNLVGYTLWVQGSSHYGDTILKLGASATNLGAILLESANGAYQSNIVTGSDTLTNQGTIESSLGSGGNRIITGNVTNSGSIVVDAGTWLNTTGSGNTFNQNAGTINATGTFTVTSGLFNFNGGATIGDVGVYNGQLSVANTVTQVSTVGAFGTSAVILGNLSPSVTVLVEGRGSFGDAVLNLGGAATNLGTILLESANGAYQSNVATGSNTLTNLGTITTALGSGGNRIFSGTLDNQGIVSAASNDYLEITGTYEAQGGTMSGPAELVGCNLIETASPTTASTIIIAGTTDTLSSNNLAGYTILVNGNSLFNSNAILNLGGNVSNLGSILLESSNGAYQSNVATGSDTLTNQGTIEASLGSGGNRIFSGTLDNQGTVTADSNDYLEITGTYQAQGGTMSGPAELVGCNLIETASPATASTIIIAGTTDTLSSNNLAGYTILVNGNSLFNSNAILNLGGNVSNLGSILLESSNGAYQSNVATGSDTLTNQGTIEASLGSGGNRIFSGTLDNQGTVTADSNDYLEITGAYQAQGGTMSGPAELVGCNLIETASPASASTIIIAGTTDTLSSNNLAGYTILVNGNSLFNSNAILNLGGNVSNLGSILLESSNGAYQSNVATGSDTLTNQGTIEASLGSGGNRIFSGTLDNQGTVTADSNDYLEITGAYQAQGGTMSGPAELVGCNLIETASPASASTIIIAGTTDTLSSNNLAGYTIWVNGNSLFNSDAILQVGANVSNLGTILLESSNNTYQSNIASGSYTLTNPGTISSVVGSGGNRIIAVAVVNTGTINCDSNTILGTSGANLINSGLISIAGVTVTVSGQSFTNDPGGLISGYGTFSTSGVTLTNNGIIDLSPPSILGVALAPSTVTITYYDTKGMNASTVTNPANYMLIGSGGDGIFGNGNDVNESGLISGVSYNAATETATLQLSSNLPTDFYRVEVNGSNVVDASGTPLLAGQEDLVNRVLGLVPATATVILDPASDSGEFDNDGITNVTTPTFDVTVNQAGTIQMNFKGQSGEVDATESVPVAGTYQFTSATLANGTYTAIATFDTATGGTTQATTTYTINTVGPRVTAMSPDATVGTSVSDVTVTFNEPVNLNTFTPSAITLSGPSGNIAVQQPQLVSGTTYSIDFATQVAQGDYSFTIASTVEDVAGNEMDQSQSATNGGPSNSFTGTFAIGLPDLAVTFTQAPSMALMGASIPVSWTVTNVSSTYPAPSTWTDAVYISPDSVLDTSAIRLISVAAPDQSPLAAGASYSRNESVTIPAGLDTGSDFLLFVADDNDGQLESTNNANNVVAVPITLVAPDLQVTGLNVQPSNPVSGSTLVVGWNDANTGDAATSTGWVDSVSIVNTSTNQTLVTAEVPYDASSLGALEPGGSAAQQCILRLPDGDPGVGNLTITVTTNADNSVIEGNSTGTAGSNNTASVSTISTLANYPDLIVAPGSLAVTPATPQSGDSLTVTWMDKNQGNAAVNGAFSDSVLVQQVKGGSVTYITSGTVSGPTPLAVGATSATQSFRFTLPDGAAGTGDIRVTVTTDSGQTIAEYDSSGNPAYGNNTASTDVTSTLADYADLIVAPGSLAVTPTIPRSPGSVTVTWNDKNQGDAAVEGAFSDSVLVQQVNGSSVTTITSGTVSGPSPLAVGATSGTQSFSFTLPNGAAVTGNILVTVTTDSGQTIKEYDFSGNPAYGNNTATLNDAPPVFASDWFAPPLSYTTPSSGEGFGESVASNYGNVAIGAPSDNGTGAVYLYDGVTPANQSIATYTYGSLIHVFADPNPEPGDEFGASLAVVGNELVVGAPGSSLSGPGDGVVYVFDANDESTTFGDVLATLTIPGAGGLTDAHFGAAVGATNTTILVGAPGNDGGVGEAYEFQGDTTQANFGDLLLEIANPDAQAGSQFGAAVAGLGDNVIVGAPPIIPRAPAPGPSTCSTARPGRRPRRSSIRGRRPRPASVRRSRRLD